MSSQLKFIGRASEQLVGLTTNSAEWMNAQMPVLPVSSADDNDTGVTHRFYSNHSNSIDPDVHPTEHDAYLLAKSYFDLKEYRRAASVLANFYSAPSLFLRLFALYLVSQLGSPRLTHPSKTTEKSKIETSNDILGTSEEVHVQ